MISTPKCAGWKDGACVLKYERKAGEEHPIGLILCAGKSNEQIELLELSKSGIRIAQYITKLLPKKLLEKKLHEAIQRAKKLIL